MQIFVVCLPSNFRLLLYQQHFSTHICIQVVDIDFALLPYLLQLVID